MTNNYFKKTTTTKLLRQCHVKRLMKVPAWFGVNSSETVSY